MIDEDPIYKGVSEDEAERRKKYREFIKGMIKEKKMMKGEMERRVIYGSEDFVNQMTKEYKIDAVIKPNGRPKKDKNRTIPFLSKNSFVTGTQSIKKEVRVR